ncbi:MAG TPA: S1/P1 nuclease, partial [Sphingomonas sp.]|nr:S1/P1 nuclease [Sphingomonas sp.]
MRINQRLACALCIAAALAPSTPAFAWSNQGHMVTGAIAYDDLARTDPALIAKIEAIMADHPDKARFDRALAGFSGEARTRRLFELMARWPDDARKGPYDHPGWHYWLRLVPSQADPAKIPPAMLAMSTGEAAEAYRLNLATVRDAYAPAADRAVSLCWLFHLAGDIQQPLH